MSWTDEEFRRVFEALYPPVVRFLRGLTGEEAQARDLAQEAFLRLYRQGPPASGAEAARFWIFRTARNLAVNERRRRGRWRRIASLLGRPSPPAEPGAAEALERREEARAQLRLLGEIPPDQRAALLLREQEGMAYAEIAAALGVSPSKVKVDIHRARTRLRAAWRREAAGGAPALSRSPER